MSETGIRDDPECPACARRRVAGAAVAGQGRQNARFRSQAHRTNADTPVRSVASPLLPKSAPNVPAVSAWLYPLGPASIWRRRKARPQRVQPRTDRRNVRRAFRQQRACDGSYGVSAFVRCACERKRAFCRPWPAWLHPQLDAERTQDTQDRPEFRFGIAAERAIKFFPRDAGLLGDVGHTAGAGCISGAPYGNRTRVSALRGPRPRPLDEGSVGCRNSPMPRPCKRVAGPPHDGATITGRASWRIARSSGTLR